MKDIIREAVARAAQENNARKVAPPTNGVAQVVAPMIAVGKKPPATSGSQDDLELVKALGQLTTKIKVIGCGGGGTNTINRCVEAGIENVDFVACNTDAQHLLMIRSPRKILLGRHTTRGL